MASKSVTPAVGHVSSVAPSSHTRQFCWLSKAWYAAANLKNVDYADEVCFGLYGDGYGTGEMLMRWYPLQSGKPTSPRLEVFCDAWLAMHAMPDVLAHLAKLDDQDIAPAAFCKLLLSLGFVDATPYEDERAQ